MKKLFTSLGIAIYIIFLSNSISYAQLSGAYTIPGSYASISAAITALNTSGVSGPVIFNIAAGWTETGSNMTLTNTTPNATNTVIFQKSGAGANPKITAGVGTSTTLDGIIKFAGTDYVTFDGIDLYDPPSNTTSTTQMEWGYAILKASTTNGSQNITIKNCRIVLNTYSTIYTNTIGIYLANHTTSSTASLAVTNFTGTNSNCSIFNNTIDSAYIGISLNGYNSTTYYDTNNAVGVGGANYIYRHGGSSATAYGIYAIYQNRLKIANNSINGGTYGTRSHTATLYGIFTSAGTNSSLDLYSNIVTVVSSATTSNLNGIYNDMGAGGSTNTVNIYNNVVQSCTYTTASTGVFNGVYQSSTSVPVFLNFYGNSVINNTYGSATATATGTVTYLGVYGTTTVAGSIYNIYNNTVSGNSRIQSVSGAGSSYLLNIPAGALTTNIFGNILTGNTSQACGTFYGINLASAPASASAQIYCYQNRITNNSRTGSPGTITGYFYGIYDVSISSSGGTTNIYNNGITGNTFTAHTTYDYVYYLALSSSYGTHNIYGDTIANNTSYYIQAGIYIATLPPTINVNDNVIYGLTASSTYTLYGIYKDSYSGSTTLNIFNNKIYGMTLSTSVNFYGIYTYYGSNVNIYGNNIYSISSPFSIYGIYIYGYSATPYTTTNVYNNNVYSLTSTSSSVYCIYQNYGAGTNSYQNNIYNITAYGIIYGIYLYYGYGSGLTYNVYRNNIYSLSSTSNNVYGIYRSANTLSTNNFYKNNIYNLSTSYSSGQVWGIYTYAVTAAGTIFNTYNNFISDLRTTTSGLATTPYLMGINHNSSTVTNTCNDYYNTIYLSATSTSTTFSSACIFTTDNTYITHEMKNNILINNSTPGSSGRSVAYWRSASTNLNNYSSNSNYNCFYSGTPGTTRLIYYDGTNSDQTLASFQSRVNPRDIYSITELPPFINISSTPYNLHLNTTTITNCESGGQRITSPIAIMDDWDGNTRWGEIGYSGAGAAPDIGADEGDFAHNPQMVVDSANTVQVAGFASIGGTNQNIIRIDVCISNSFNPPAVTQFTVNANGTTDINDINLSNAKIYFTGTSSTFSATSLFGSASPSITDFTISGSQRLTAGGTNYFWLAYDISPSAPLGNVIDGECNNIQLTCGSYIPLNTAPPGNKMIVGPMSGVYYVGRGNSFPNFTTLTDAMYHLNLRGISGPTTFYLTNSAAVPYNSANGETFPIVINPITGATSTNTILIAPNSGVQPVIQDASATNLIKFNGTDYLTLDGSNSVGISKDLTIYDASTASNTAPIYIASTGVGAGSTNLIIKNCNISAGSNTVATQYGIYIGGSSIGTSGYDNDNVTIQNNYIKTAYYGIYVSGSSTGVFDNLNILQNTIGAPVGVSTDYIGYSGLYLAYCTNALVSQNNIQNIITSALTPIGMYISTNVLNSTISKNKIGNVNYIGGGGYGSRGMYIITGNTTSNLTITNNLIYQICGDGWTTFAGSSPVGIYLDGTVGGVNLYYNSVYMSGTLTQNMVTLTSAILFSTTTITNIDCRDNIFQNSMNNSANGSAKNYAIYSTSPSTSYTQINNNDYWVSGSQGVLGYLGTDITNLAAWQTATGKDLNSINTDPLFQSTTDLRPLLGSPEIGAGTPIGSVPDDYLGNTRSVTTPTIGAYENGVDLSGPAITYTPLTNSMPGLSKVLSEVHLIDISGTPLSGSYITRIYYKKMYAGTWYSAAGSLDSGTAVNGWWSFTINYSDFGGVAYNDSIYYYVIAQDNLLPPNVSSNPSGVVASDVNTVTTPPANPNKFKIVVSPLSGLYTVGLSAFNKVTGKNITHSDKPAFDKIKSKQESDAVTKNTSEKDIIKKNNSREDIKQNKTDNIISQKNNNTSKNIKSDNKINLNEGLLENGKPYTGPNKIYFKKGEINGKQFGLNDSPNGMYATLSSAISDLNERGISSSVTFVLVDNTYPSEVYPITIFDITGATTTNTVTIQPLDGIGTVTISGDNASELFDLNGGSYITFDGRPYGNTTPKQLIIRNTNATTTSSTIRFINDAAYNTIQYCQIEGCGTSYTAGGTIFFSNTTGSTGNSHNVIQNNDIRDRSDVAGTPSCAILNIGSVSNDYNMILNNNIFNTFSSTATCVDMYLNGGLGKWTISGNSFYQTSTRSPSNAAAYFTMILTSVSDSFTVSNNYLGGTAPMCGGTPLTYTDGAGFLCFRIWQTGSANPTIFSGNTITNIDYSTSSTGGQMFLRCADVASNTGTTVNVVNNTFGSSTGQDGIILRYNPVSSTGSPSPTVIAFGMTGGAISSWPRGTIQNNNIGGITLTGNGTTTGTMTLQAMNLSSYCQNISVSGNNIGNSTAQNFRNLLTTVNTSIYGINSVASVGYLGTTNILNNTIRNLYNASTATGSANFLRGIFHSGTDSLTIQGNTIQELNCMSQYAGTYNSGGADIIGIGTSSASTLQNIVGNIITGIRSATTAAFNTYAVGIGNSNSSAIGTIARNRIYDITNTSTGAAAYIIGIENYAGNWTVANNQVTLTNGEATDNLKSNSKSQKNLNALSDNVKGNNTNGNDNIIKSSPVNITATRTNNINTYNTRVESNNDKNEKINNSNKNISNDVTEIDESALLQILGNNITRTENKPLTDQTDLSTNGVVIYGIFDNATLIGSYYYNTVYIGGTESAGTTNSFCLYRMGTPNIVLKNNLLYNGRVNSGTATGKHYAIGISANAITSNYNSFVTANTSTLGYYGSADQTFATWKSTTSGDGFSYATTTAIIPAANLFSSISTGNLNINSANAEAWLVSGKGTFVSGQSTDFEGSDSRSVSLVGGVTDIGSDEFIATPPNCPVAIESAVPSGGITTDYSIFGRTIVSITWGSGGTSYPDGMNVIYYSGITPPGSNGNNAFSYSNVTPSGGTLADATYDVTTYFTDAETYTIINPSTDIRLAKYTNSEWWVYLTAGTGAEQTELNWTSKWAKVRGLSTFSYFSLSDVTNPLPVLLTSFTSSINGRDVKLIWTLEREENSAGYEIQRIKNSELNTESWTNVGYVKSKGNSSTTASYNFEDKKLVSGKYNYRLKHIDINGGTRYFSLNNIVDVALPTVFNLSQNYPNPFNPVTKIDYQLPFDSRVRIVVYDMLGREVKILTNSEMKQAGFYTLELNASTLSSGTYFYRMIANSQGKDYIFTKKMSVVK